MATQTWQHGGFVDFSRGRFETGGENLYVNAKGEIETIHRTGLLNNGRVDIVLPNSHGYIERGPTWIYKPAMGVCAAACRDGPAPARSEGEDWPRRELPNDSGWMSRVVDLDGDGCNDLVVVNGENGVTSELDSYVYWGGPEGLTEERAALPTIGAYDVAVVDVDGDGRLDLVFPSAWRDHHSAGVPLLLKVYRQSRPREFEDASEQFNLIGVGAVSVACADLNHNGKPDLVVANYRSHFEYDTDSFVYWGTGCGFDSQQPMRLPTHYATQVLTADLNGDGFDEIIFSGGHQVWIYWNDAGRFSCARRTIIEVEGNSSMFALGAVRVEVADVDGDDRNELLFATAHGVEIRRADDLQTVAQCLTIPYATWLHAADLDGDGRPELIASKYEDHVNYETQSAIFWNSADGFSQDRVSWLDTCGAMGCTAGDTDGDGRPAVIFNGTMRGPSKSWPEFPSYVYLGGEGGDYGTHRRLELPTGGETYTYIMADLDLDGYPDLVFTNEDGLRIYPGGPDGPQPNRYYDLATPAGEKHQAPIMEVYVADLNRDGYLDLLAAVQTYDDKPQTMAHSSVIFWGSADGFSSHRCQVLPTYSSGKAHLADLTRNGYLDIVFSDKRRCLSIFQGGPGGYSPDRVETIQIGVPRLAYLNAADLNGNGYLDLVVGIMSHYERGSETVYVLYGGPDGYHMDNCQKYLGNYSPLAIAIADLDTDGKLEMIVSAYSSAAARVLPMQIFRTDGGRIDFEHPTDMVCESACGAMALDLNGNGYRDLVVVNHRNDLGHQVDSLIYWNGPDGISQERTTPLPGLGPHMTTTRDPGNALTRGPYEYYISPPYPLKGRLPLRLSWDAHVPGGTSLRFQLRWARSEALLDAAAWQGATGENSFYVTSDQQLGPIPAPARWLQYRAIFGSPNGALSPRLRHVQIDMGQHP